MTTRKYSSRSQQTTLTSAVTAGDTTISVVSGSGLLGGVTIPAGTTFTLVIDPDTALEEIVDATAVSTNTFTITRGVDGSSAVEHSAGAAVRHMAIGRDYRDANLHAEADTGYNDGGGNAHTMHGIAAGEGVVVGTLKTQTLTNKTLTSPTINTPTIVDPTITGTATAGASLVFEGSTADANETTLTVVDPTQDNTITLPNTSGTVVLDSATQTLTNKTLTSPTVNGGTLAGSITASATVTLTGGVVVSGGSITGLSSAGMVASSATPKNYVDSILGSATAASTSAASAATSAASAATSASSAATSATSAANSASAASTSATSASNSATAAASSATAAASSATAAATSATSAAASATAAATSASSASTSASSALTSANSASTSASSASTSASSAASSASAAATSATSAAASATAAASSATAAATSAASAATSATSAANSATAAASSAAAAAGYVVPSQTGNEGKFLQTDGSTTSWSNTVVVNSSSDAFRITQTGTGNAFVVEDSTNPDSTPFLIDGAGNVVVGYSVPTGYGGINPLFGVVVDSTTNSGAVFAKFSGNANPIFTQYFKARGTAASPTIVSSGDSISQTRYMAYDGATMQQAAQIAVEVDATPAAGDMPGRIRFFTTPAASVTPTERMRINNAGEVGIGAASTTGVTLFIAKNITGATTAYGIAHNGTAQSDVTSTAYGISSRVNSAAASYTLSNLIAFQATAGSVGAGSTITNAYGFNVPSGFTQGSTLNIGFNGALAANASVNYNLYMGGTAPNYLRGATGIGAVASGAMTFIVNDTAANAGLIVRGAASQTGDLQQWQNSAGTSLVVVNSAGNVGIGTTSPLYKLHTETDAANIIASIRNSTDSNPAHLYLSKRRGTAASPTVVVSGDNLGQITFYGYDGSALQQAALIQGSVDATPGTNDMPGRLTFWTTPDGSTIPAERMRITNAGNVGVGITTPAQLLHLRTDSSATTIRVDAGANNAGLTLARANTSWTSPSVVASGDILGVITFQGYDGSTVRNAAQIQGIVNGTPGAGDMPGALAFFTTPDGSSTLSERMRIDNAGRVGIGTASPNQTLTVAGDMELRNNGVTPPTINFTSQDGTTNVWQIDGQVSDSVNGGLIVNNNGTERLRLTSTGGLIVGNGFTSATPNTGGIYGTSGTGTNIAGANFGVYGGASTGNAAGGAVSIYTSPAGTSGSSTNTLTERLKVDSAGLITGTGTSLGAWTSYTPTWGGNTTNPVIGNGTISGSYCRIGKTVHVRIKIIAGSTTTFGSGAYYVSNPITALGTDAPISSGWILDSSTATRYAIMAQPASTTNMWIRYGTNVTAADSASPMTFAASDEINLAYTYEVA